MPEEMARCRLPGRLSYGHSDGPALACFLPWAGSQSQNVPFVGSSAMSFASWQRYSGTPERTICFIRIRVSDIALALQSQGIGIIASNPSF